MKKIYLIFFILIGNAISVHAQTEWAAGPYAAGMGGCSGLQGRNWSLFNNPAGLAEDSFTSISFYSENRFLQSGLNRGQLAVSHHTSQGTLGIGFSTFGNEVFHRQQISVGMGRALGKSIHVGIGLHYLMTKMGFFGNLHSLAAGIGIQYKLTPQVQIGVYVFNPNRSRIGAGRDERHPSLFRSSIMWIVNSALTLRAESDLALDLGPVWKGGAEYHITKEITLRGGFSTQPISISMGASFIWKKLEFSASVGYHPNLGPIPGLGGLYTYNPSQKITNNTPR